MNRQYVKIRNGAPRCRASWLLIAALTVSGLAPTVTAADQETGDIRRCVTIDDATQRLSCYDAAAGRSAPGDTPPPDKTLDDLGAETLPTSARKREDEVMVRATVTGCEKDPGNKYVFFFENGQIWKQSGSKRLYLKECNFDVTITRDFFGYRMLRDGDKGRIRIARIR